MKQNLEQEIAEFLFQMLGIAGLDRIENLVGFLNQIRSQGRVRLPFCDPTDSHQVREGAPGRRPGLRRVFRRFRRKNSP